jgi:hypothetical protein
MRTHTIQIGAVVAFAAAGIASALPRTSEARKITSNGGRYVLEVTEPDGGFVRGKPLAFDVRVARADDPTKAAPVGLLVDADMPEHLHGINRVPRVERRADGTFRVENLYLHMPGWWEVFLDVVETPWTERAQVRVEIE